MRTLYLFPLIMISIFAKSQSLSCADFKVGTFKLEVTNYKFSPIIVYRSENIQKESTEGSKDLEGTIEWKSECSYELIYLNAPPDMNGRKVSAEIVKIEDKKAICRSTCEGMPGIILEFEMEKLK